MRSDFFVQRYDRGAPSCVLNYLTVDAGITVWFTSNLVFVSRDIPVVLALVAKCPAYTRADLESS